MSSTEQTHFVPGAILLRLPSVCQKVGLQRSTIYRMAAAGTFPAPVRLGARCSAWSAEAVDAWIEERLGDAGALP